MTTLEEVFIKVGEGTDETLEQRYVYVYMCMCGYIRTYTYSVHVYNPLKISCAKLFCGEKFLLK